MCASTVASMCVAGRDLQSETLQERCGEYIKYKFRTSIRLCLCYARALEDALLRASLKPIQCFLKRALIRAMIYLRASALYYYRYIYIYTRVYTQRSHNNHHHRSGVVGLNACARCKYFALHVRCCQPATDFQAPAKADTHRSRYPHLYLCAGLAVCIYKYMFVRYTYILYAHNLATVFRFASTS